MTATQSPLLSGGEQQTPGGGWPAGWYDDPHDRSAKRYWDGGQWTQHFTRPSTPSSATPPDAEPQQEHRGIHGWVRRRPALALWSTLGVALIAGIALGAAAAGQEDASSSPSDKTRISELSTELDQSRAELETAKGALTDTEDDLDAARDKLSSTREKLRDARAEARSGPAPAPAPAAPSPGSGDSGGRSFSGNGTKNLGTITITEESVLKWTNDGLVFIVSDDDFGLSVNSDAPSGDTVLQPGTYKNVEVMAEGNWSIEIEAR
jgi:hypothetical protein